MVVEAGDGEVHQGKSQVLVDGGLLKMFRKVCRLMSPTLALVCRHSEVRPTM